VALEEAPEERAVLVADPAGDLLHRDVLLLADNEAVIRAHAERSGFPATHITEIRTVIDPTTAIG
jgi:hypothetical protein